MLHHKQPRHRPLPLTDDDQNSATENQRGLSKPSDHENNSFKCVSLDKHGDSSSTDVVEYDVPLDEFIRDCLAIIK